MSLDLNGSWVNSYGSKMDLLVAEDGGIVGQYSSTTGSTGLYGVIGQCSPGIPQTGKGLAVVLSIYWHPVNSETPDESWHWVSTYCGQLLENGELSVINSLVATSSFSGFSPGDYIDKLAFKKVSSTFSSTLSKTLDKLAFSPDREATEHTVYNSINGEWVGNNPSVKLALTVTNIRYGLVQGVAEYQNARIILNGFTDTHVSGLNLQSISVCGLLQNLGDTEDVPLSLSGWLDLSNNSLQLSRWVANATSLDNVYYQSDVESWLLNKK